ncbi:GNAT family N-acetyltransferase [Neobacillus cucumis]|uniref:GNAT family N-acetyltransferase n=1 Tax=Neobacillus cucumis TaxID=1740721 RepID=A0A2N5HP28_9BACI|nr:GNAT family N-acetyltransferase [Neobacillus cucumis]PLS07282.1 GNAT family N-acetyltransferase [Neobacillus cucumis]
MIKELDLNQTSVLKEVFDLQKESYLVEAQIINFYEIPPFKETINELKDSGETFLGYYKGECLAGAISYTLHNQELTICRMVVHPDHFRKGIAQKLLTKVEEHHQDISILHVSTGRDNPPAKNLYLKNGYQWISDQEVVPNFYISHYRKEKHHPE